MVAITVASADRTRTSSVSPGAQRISRSVSMARPRNLGADSPATADSLPPIVDVPWLRRLATYRKAVVSGLGAMMAVAVSVKDPLGFVLPGATQWIAVGMAVATAIATYLTTNHAAPPPAVAPVPSPGPDTEQAHDIPEPRARFGTAVAGLLLVTGAMLWNHRSRRSRGQDTPNVAVIVHPNDLAGWLTKHSSTATPDWFRR